MTTGLSRMASRALKPDTLEIPEIGFGIIKGSNGEAGPMTAGNARTKGTNPPMVDGFSPSPESDDL